MPTFSRLAKVVLVLVAVSACNPSDATVAMQKDAHRFIGRSEKLLARLGSKGMEQEKFRRRRSRLLTLADKVDLASLSATDRTRIDSLRSRLLASCATAQPIERGCVLGGSPLPGKKMRFLCE